MICEKKGHQGGENCVTCIEHAVFKAAGERRREKGIKLGRWTIMVDKNQLASIDEFYQGWVEMFGKQRAADYLIVCMRKADEALRESLNKPMANSRKVGPVKYEKVSAPRVED